MLAEAALPPLTWARALTVWQPAPLVDVILGLLAAGYLVAARRVRRAHPARPWPRWRGAAFILGLAVIAAAGQSGLAAYDGVLFSMHMVQHVLLIMVAPPLLVVGRPITLLLHAARNPVHTWVKRAVRSRAAAAVTWPPAVTLGYAAVVVGTHTPPVMDLVVRSEAAHAAEHALYLATGYLFFLLVVGSEPVRWRVPPGWRFLMLLVAMQVDTVVGVVFMIAGHEVFAAYRGPGALADLHTGGIVMWMGSDIVMSVIAVAVAVALVRPVPRPASRAAGPSAAADAAGDAALAAYNSYLASLGQAARRPAGLDR